MAMYKRLKGLGFRRLSDGTWARLAQPGDLQRLPEDRLDFWRVVGTRPVLVVSVLDDEGYFAQVTLYGSVWATTIGRFLTASQMARVVQQQMNAHRVRGRLPDWRHQPA